MPRISIAPALFACLLLGLLLASCAGTTPGTRIGAEVTVTGGMARGVLDPQRGAEGALRHFHGVPFTAPPVGRLCWAPPAPVVPWDGVLPADRAGAFCPRPVKLGVGFYITERSNQSEDCLTPNVWTHADDTTERRPVMVWVHGGGLVGGAGFEQTGQLLSRKGAVLVTFNYRLGRLGFLAHPGLTQENPCGVSGNQGFRDQIAALEWVR